VAEYSYSPQELIDLLRAHLRPSGLPAAFDGMIALVDGTIHQQNIRRPLHLLYRAKTRCRACDQVFFWPS
jgi:hypothetical protein